MDRRVRQVRHPYASRAGVLCPEHESAAEQAAWTDAREAIRSAAFYSLRASCRPI